MLSPYASFKKKQSKKRLHKLNVSQYENIFLLELENNPNQNNIMEDFNDLERDYKNSIIEANLEGGHCLNGIEKLFKNLCNNMSEIRRINIYTVILSLIFIFTCNEAILQIQFQKEVSGNVFFEENLGQWDKEIKYRSFGASDLVSFFQNQVRVNLINDTIDSQVVQIIQNFNNSNTDIRIESSKPNVTKTNYLLGNDFSKHIKGVSQYSQIKYKNIYSNIDLSYQSKDGKIKHDFIVNPSGKVSDINIGYGNVDKISVNEKGELVINTLNRRLIESELYAYQIIDQELIEIACNYVLLNDSSYTFSVGEYNPNYSLVIDPVWLNWSTFCGGIGAVRGWNMDIETDQDGFVYGVARYGVNFPTTNGSSAGTNGNNRTDGVVYKLDPSGSSLIWATYIGGTSNELFKGIKVNDNKEVFICGATSSSNFPITTSAFDTSFSAYHDAFVMRLDSTCSNIIYSTLLSGSKPNTIFDIEIDCNNFAYAVGTTSSLDFPVENAIDSTFNGGLTDAYLVKITPDGTAAEFSTFIGGNDYDMGASVALSNNGDIFVLGATRSDDLPTTNSYDSSYNLGVDYYISKISNNGDSILALTYFGGSADDGPSSFDHQGFDIFVTNNEEVVVVGYTFSDDFPTTSNAYDQTYSASVANYNHEGIVSKFSSNLDTLHFSTFLGGTSNSLVSGVVVDNDGNIWVTGETITLPNHNNDFPVTLDALKGVLTNSYSDLFISKLTGDGATLLYSTFYGGDQRNEGNAHISLGKDNEIVIGAFSSSTDFPTTAGAFQLNRLNMMPTGPSEQPIILKLLDSSSFVMNDIEYCPYLFYTNQNIQVCSGECVDLLPIHGGVSLPGEYTWSTGETDSTIVPITVCPYLDTVYYVVWEDTSGFTDTLFVPVEVKDFELNLVNDTVICNSGSFTVDVLNEEASYIWSNGSDDHTTTIDSSGKYWVTVTYLGCLYSDTMDVEFVNYSLELGNDTVICDLDSFLIELPNTGATYIWSNGSSNYTTIIDSSGIYWATGIYNGCSYSDTIIVQFIDFSFDLGNDTTICKGDSILLIADEADQYSWSNGTTTQSTYVNESGEYSLIAINEGCYYGDSIEISFMNCITTISSNIIVPNIFTPNDDNHNDFFKPKIEGSIEVFQMIIYNRWGEMMFLSDNQQNLYWDGKYKEKEVPEGTYYWIVNYKNSLNERISKEGALFLVR